jgi:hypothetical protein
MSTNPKDAIGSVKLPLHLWPAEASALGCLGMLEGALKYGRNNFISGDGVVLSIYMDALKRHVDAIMSGEDLSPDVLNLHFGNALSCLAIPVKALAHGKLVDDRDYSPKGVPAHLKVAWPTTGYRAFVEFLTPWVKRLKEHFKDHKAPKHWTIADNPPEIDSSVK